MQSSRRLARLLRWYDGPYRKRCWHDSDLPDSDLDGGQGRMRGLGWRYHVRHEALPSPQLWVGPWITAPADR